MPEKLVKARFKVGDKCRCLHKNAFRGKETFTIVSIAVSPYSPDSYGCVDFRYVYIVQYADGVLDAIPIWNEGGYVVEKIHDKKEGS